MREKVSTNKTKVKVGVWLLTTILVCLTVAAFTKPVPTTKVYLRLETEVFLDAEVRQHLEHAAIELLQSSNFNSVYHSDLLRKTTPNVQYAYRQQVSGDFLLVTFNSPKSIKTIGGTVEAYEIIIGFGEEYADSLFTIDSVGRVVQHEKYAGDIAIKLLKLVKKVAKNHSNDMNTDLRKEF